MKVIGSLTTGMQKKGDPDLLQGLVCKLNESQPITCIKFVAQPIKKLPAWHPAKGKPSWVFVDEVFLN